MHLTFKVCLKTYDNMYNIQDNIINPITFNFLINEKFKYFPILHVHFYTTSINLNITTSFLYLYKYLYANLNFKKDFNDVKNSNIEIYNDLHSEIIIFYKTRTKNNNYTWKLNIIDKNEYHQFPCECLYFCINKKKEKKKMNSEIYDTNRNSEDFMITNEHDLNSIFRDICKIGFKKRNLHNSVAKHEKHLLYDNTQSVYDILHQFTYRMPFLYKNHDNDNKIINIIKKKPSWIYIGVLYTDDLYSRAYKVPNVKHNLLVEPEIIRNKWCLSIGTCIQIENNSGLYFRIYKEGKTKYFSRVNFKWKLGKNRKSSGNYSEWETLDGGTKNEKHKKKTKGKLKNYHHQHDQHDHHIHHHRNNKHFTAHVEKNKKKERSKNGDYINILPFSKRAIPLFWLYDCSLPYIKILRKKEKKYNMKNLRKSNKEEEENLDIEAVPFHILYKLLNKYALNNNNIYQKKLDISPCEIIFQGLLMFHCFVKVKDVPTQHIKDTSYNYTVVIEPMVTIKNNLPNPITVIVRMKKKKRFFSISKNKQENEVEEKMLHKSNYEMNDDITKILKKQEMFALVPPHHYWCLPICTQAFYMKVFYHGLQIEKMNFIYDYANEIKGYYDFKDVKLPEWNEAFYGGNINSAMKKGDQGSSAAENSGVNVTNHRANDDRTGDNDKNLHSNHNSSNGGSVCNIKEEHAKNVNYWQYRSRGASNVVRDSRLFYEEMMKEFQNKERNGEITSCNSPNRQRKKTIYDNLFRNSTNNIGSFDENEENNYQSRNNFMYNFLYATEGFFHIYMPSTDTITSTKVLNHKFGLIGNIFSYEELKYIYFENKISQINKKVYDNLHIFKNITVSADVSRRKIDFYFPFFFENTTNVCIYVNNKLLPPNSRLYMTEEEAKGVRIKSYKHDHANNVILCSNVSGKIDCTRTNMIRPLINLIYRKINRKQKVRFWEKYEERKKKYSNMMNTPALEEEEEHTSGDDADMLKRTSIFKLKVVKDVDDGGKDKDDNLINDYDGEVDKQGTDGKKNTNGTNYRNDVTEVVCAKSLTNETNKEEKQNELGEHTPGKPSEKTEEINSSENLSDTHYLPHNKNDLYYCNSKFSEMSAHQNEENGKSTKKSPTHKSYKNAFKNILMSNKTLFKRRRKMSEKSSESIGNFKKIKRFRLFHKHKKGGKINAERDEEEYSDNIDERGEPYDNDGNEDSVDSSYYDGHENDSKLRKKSKKRKNMKRTNFSYSRRGKGHKKFFSKNLYSLDKLGHKYFSKEKKKKKKDLSSQGGRDIHDSFSSENEKPTGAFPASQVSFSIFQLFKEKEETGKCSEFDEDISDDNVNEQIEMEKEEEADEVEAEEEEEEDEKEGDEEDEDDAFHASKKRKNKRDILKFRLMKKGKKRKKEGEHENELENESEKNNSKFRKGKKKTYKKKRFKMAPFFSSVDRRHKGKVPIGSANHAKYEKLSSGKYNLEGSSSESGNYNNVTSKEKPFERGQKGGASRTRVSFRERNLQSRRNGNDVQVEVVGEAGDEAADEAADEAVDEGVIHVNHELGVKGRKSLRDISRHMRESRKSKMKKKDYYEAGFLSLGICVRYAEEPFNKSKIVTFVNSYIFINRLPFDVKIATDSVRKSDSIFTIHNATLHSDFNNPYKEMLPLDALTIRKSANNIKSLGDTMMEKDVCAINVGDGSRVRENFKLDICKDQVADIDAFRIGDTKMERNTASGGAKKTSTINNNSFNEHGGHIEGNSNLVVNRSSTNYDHSEAPTGEANQTEQPYTAISKNANDEKIGENNETYIRSGEITAFHYNRSYIKIKDSSEGYSSQPFSLIPKNVPSNFQIELFNMNKSQINNTNNLLVEVNVCSGIFGDKQQLPYTYNGYFYILSLPVRPQFEIINATKFIIAYATDVNKYTKKYMNNNYDTYLRRSTKNGDFPVKMIYPYSSIYYTLRNNNEIESSKIALKIVGVQKSSWCINTINSFIDNVVMLPYRIYGENKLSSEKKFKGRRNSHKKDDAYFITNRRNSQKTHLQGNRGNVVLGEFHSNGGCAEVDNEKHILNGDGEKEDNVRREKIEKDNIFLGHNLVNKKLYSFLIIRDNGSRAIVITEKYNLAREIVTTKNFSKIHRLIAISSRKKILLSNKNANRKYMLDYKKMNFVYFNFPIVPVIYNFNIPRLTVTWIHRQDVIIAIHLSNLKYSGHIYPKEIINYDINHMFTPINILKRKEVEEYVQYVFLNSYVDSIFLIEQIHIDHFVKGDIPVILKNTNIEENEDIFLYIHVKQYCVDSFKQAPIYQSIMIKISPINANIELLVIEQLIEIIEKEKQLLLLYEREEKSLPPLIATSETARNAINTTLKIFSDANFLKMIYLDDYIRRKTENDFILKNNQIVNNNIILNSTNRDENKYKTVRNYERKHVKESEAEIKPNAYSYYFSSPQVRMITQNRIININNISEKICSEDSTNSSISTNPCSKNKNGRNVHKKICKILVGYYKYKKVHNLINNTYYDISNMNDERVLPIKIQYFRNQKIFMNAFSSHLFLHPNPRWMDNKSKPVYIREFKINPIEIIASIRTSEHRISRRILHIVDALPVDTPSMRIHLISQKRNYIVCTWDGLFQSLRVSYFRQLLRQSLPSAWLSNPFAFIKGFIKGITALFKETVRGVKTSSNFFDGFMSGFKCGIIILVVNTVGGLFQSLSHMLNVCHKLMGGSRPRPPSILDSIILGLDGLLLDTFYRPWVSLFNDPKISLNKGNSTLKTVCIIIGCILRCIFAPIFGLLNLFASITEGFANTLIGDFERFSRVQERSEFETEKVHNAVATMRRGKSIMKKTARHDKGA
ncbi:Uncharacterized protein PCOAH_00029370 [Plasmodium coatneyi]|uniref:Uncharacterized protein n=1 Tax=Plasmodium coatneyi TaxID=208452 RepID=A0A1B1E1E0_9APIC|nr:Uncharacterized protein PCOAH_00029370 [Plasmodium coatneyi]ANQ08659.1 Uncharacterized protein PCOAH_00029370 [Plasmodium coatneyi]